jgi:hypothetical protein
MGFISVSVGSSPLSTKAAFWRKLLYYDSLLRLQSEKPHHVSSITSGD